jgi:hypothetical protein
LPASEPAALDLAVSWKGADVASFLDRRGRLMSWGWPEAEAEKLAARLVRRDRSNDDDRVSCADCRHFKAGRCSNARRAGLRSTEVPRALVELLQRCPGFTDVAPA